MRTGNSARLSAHALGVFADSFSRAWLRRAWIASSISGSVIAMTLSAAFSIVAGVDLPSDHFPTDRIIALEVIVAAAVLEGAVIGYSQYRVLRRLFPTMTSGSWTGATMVAAGSGSLLNWLPTSFALTAALERRFWFAQAEPNALVRVLVTGALVGLIWGVGQYAVLRLHARRGGAWVTTSVMSWTITFMWLYQVAAVRDSASSPMIYIALGSLSGLVFGVSSALHIFALSRVHSRLLVSALLSRTQT